MKNKTIEILAEGEWKLPKGTGLCKHSENAEPEYFNGAYECVANTIGDKDIYEVDFSKVEPLYPTKGMSVPIDGIEFVDGCSELIDSGSNGFTLKYSDGTTMHVRWGGTDGDDTYELKRTLPKTITVCAECHKEVCECVNVEAGKYYRVSGECGDSVIAFCSDNLKLLFCGDEHEYPTDGFNIDLDNPINVIPEGEND